MDRNFIIAIILSTLVIILFASPWYQQRFGDPIPVEITQTEGETATDVAPSVPVMPPSLVQSDPKQAEPPSSAPVTATEAVSTLVEPATIADPAPGEIVQVDAPAYASPVVISNSQMEVTITPSGGAISRVLLPEFDGPTKDEPVSLIPADQLWYDCYVQDGDETLIVCRDLVFSLEKLTVQEVIATAMLSDGRTIKRRFALDASGYALHANTTLDGPWDEPVLHFAWHGPIEQTEQPVRQLRIWPFSMMMRDEATMFQKLVYLGQGDRTTKQPGGKEKSTRIYANEGGQKLEPKKSGDWSDSFAGDLEWFAVRNKYFMSSAIPDEQRHWASNATYSTIDTDRWFDFTLTKAASGNTDMTIYMGPIRFETLKSYDRDLTQAMEMSFKYIRPLSILFLWIIKKIQSVIPNWGLVIILFSILIKLVVYPLSKSSFDSMRKMSDLQPQIAELKAKYPNNAQKLQQETMALYKSKGVNPFGGCLPMLLQMPVFFALYPVVGRAFELRQAMFVPGWIEDLSRPDPFYILPVAMGVSMFFQSKATMKDPQQKPMLYIMPVMMVILFANFGSGLTLYWFLFNIFSYLQQKIHRRD
jgi:YidC/Oxa1 family membrane protein insertase